MITIAHLNARKLIMPQNDDSICNLNANNLPSESHNVVFGTQTSAVYQPKQKLNKCCLDQ